MPDPTTTQSTAPAHEQTEAATNKPAKPEEGFFRNYTTASLLSYIRNPPEGDPFDLELEAMREGRRRVDAGTLGEASFKKAMEANYYNSTVGRQK